MISLATTLPENSHDGYVVAAYIVFFALILIYVAIMAVRLGRAERKLDDMQREREGGTSSAAAPHPPEDADATYTDPPEPTDETLERETV